MKLTFERNFDLESVIAARVERWKEFDHLAERLADELTFWNKDKPDAGETVMAYLSRVDALLDDVVFDLFHFLHPGISLDAPVSVDCNTFEAFMRLKFGYAYESEWEIMEDNDPYWER